MIKMSVKLPKYIFKRLPECNAKEKIIKIYYRYFCNPLYVLNKMVTEINQQNDAICVKLMNGFTFCDSRDPSKKSKYYLKYGDPKKLNKLIEYKESEGFFNVLAEQFIMNLYERRYSIKKGDVVVSIGASVGTNTLVFSKKVGSKGKVIAIEPDMNRLKYLEKNIRINKLENNIIIIKKGVWCKKSRMNFYKKAFFEGLSMMRPDEHSIKSTIEVDTLDNILADLNIKKVDFIKMDIEGAEIEALKGIKETLKNNDTKLAIASYHIVDGQPTYKTIIPMMKEMGFKSYFSNGICYFER